MKTIFGLTQVSLGSAKSISMLKQKIKISGSKLSRDIKLNFRSDIISSSFMARGCVSANQVNAFKNFSNFGVGKGFDPTLSTFFLD